MEMKESTLSPIDINNSIEISWKNLLIKAEITES